MNRLNASSQRGEDVEFSTPLKTSSDITSHPSAFSSSRLKDLKGKETVSQSSLDSNAHTLVQHKVYWFGIDLSMNLGPAWFKFCLVVGALVAVMCTYSYCQEQLFYTYLGRSHSVFASLISFGGGGMIALTCKCTQWLYSRWTVSPKSGDEVELSVFGAAEEDEALLDSNSPDEESQLKSSHTIHISPHADIGHAPSTVSIFWSSAVLYFVLLIILKTASQALGDMSMAHITYPAKVLTKSASPILTMAIGVAWLGQRYSLVEYFLVILMICGLYLFTLDDLSGGDGGSSVYGYALICLSVMCSAGIPLVHEYCVATHRVTFDDILLFSYFGSFTFALIYCHWTGELYDGIAYVMNNWDGYAYLTFFAYNTTGYMGASMNLAITVLYGAVVTGLVGTFRKTVTLALSFIFFPTRNTISVQKLFGIVILLGALTVRSTLKTSRK